MANPMDSVADYYTPRKGNLQLCQNYQPHQAFEQIVLKVILNRLKTPKNRLGSELEGHHRTGITTIEDWSTAK